MVLNTGSREQDRLRIGGSGSRLMEITQANTDGLKRTLNIVIGANELSDRFTERLGEFRERVQLKGFRKGKVPVAHLKKLYGRSLMAEVLDQAVRDTCIAGDRRPQGAAGAAARHQAA